MSTAANSAPVAEITNEPVGVGIIGAGVISTQYLDNLTTFPDVKVIAIGDLIPEAAEKRAKEYGVELYGDVDVVLNNPDVKIVVNLTIPAAHVEVGLKAVAAGKHVWSEKPFAMDRASGQELLHAAKAKGVMLACAPDTFLGPGLQTARRLIEAGEAGTPLSATCVMQYPGPDMWHPAPEFLFAKGAGPTLDMGPYYITALVQIFGAIKSVAAVGRKMREEREIGSGPNQGKKFPVEVPTHVNALLTFQSGATAQCLFSFDTPKPNAGIVEINGETATLNLPDPNTFGGTITATYKNDPERETATFKPVGIEAGRGLGVLDMILALREGRTTRASAEQAFHVLDALLAIEESAATGAFVELTSTVQVPPPVDADFNPRVEHVLAAKA